MNSYKLYAIRDDKERASVARESKPFRLWLDPVSVAGSFDEWVQYHARTEKVITNRLHSAILGAILGKRVTLLPNSYHKNRSVHSYSLEERGVTWKEKIEKTLTDRFLSVLPSRITNSTKIVRSMCALRDTFRFGDCGQINARNVRCYCYRWQERPSAPNAPFAGQMPEALEF